MPKFGQDLRSNIVDDLADFKVVEQLNVVNRLCAKLIALLVTAHVHVGIGSLLGASCSVTVEEVLDLAVAQGAWLCGHVGLLTLYHSYVLFLYF